MVSFFAHGYSTLLALVLSAGWSAPAALSPALPAEDAARLAKAATTSRLPLEELEKRVATDLKSLGSLSFGTPNNGRLLNGAQLPEGPLFELVTPDFAWGTDETVLFLTRALESVHRAHPDTPPLHVGHLSAPQGGPLKPHLSHQSGRDVDLGFFYAQKRTWYRRATTDNLDLPRNWSLVRALIVETDVEMILVDRSLHAPLRAEAERQGEPRAWLDSIFKGESGRQPIIRHARGHATHFHVRFFSPLAQKNAGRAYPFLVEHEIVPPVVSYTHYKAKPGDTLGKIARNHGVSIQELQRANGLRGTLIQAKRIYKIPRSGTPAPLSMDLKIPQRRLPELYEAKATRETSETSH